MKNLFLIPFLILALFLFPALTLIAQSPQGIPYQAVMRNADGSVMASSAVNMTFIIHDGTANGAVVYQESHSLTSNAQGLVSCVVGNGVVSQGNFININWGGGAKFLHVMMGTTDLGTQQMLSVPYALYTENVGVRVSATGDTLVVGGNSVILPGVSAANYPPAFLGCTDNAACNYNSAATQNDNSCLYLNATCDDGNASTINDVINGSCVCAGTAVNNNNVVIGQDYQGGKVAYIFQPGDAGFVVGETHGLIAAAQDLPGLYQWGCLGIAISGADGQAIGTGAQNTLDIVNAGCGVAAQACADLVLNGYSDWFLPSFQELAQLYNNRNSIGGFQNNWYWSSTESDSNNAVGFQFGINYYLSFGKNDGQIAVRAVRGF
ncbi:MAG: DUF1566 domain-containing protein [Bacteroidetes bacterium]|nr:DUF1566 domain-containing protein [Bacteroidota bacterium]